MAEGKPRTSTIERRPALNMRTSPELRERLEEAARARNLSLTQEVIRRVEASFRAEESLDRESGRAATNFLVHLIRGATASIEAKTEKEWKDDARTAILCEGAITGVIETLMKPFPGELVVNKLLGQSEEDLRKELFEAGRQTGRVFAQDRLSSQVKTPDEGAWSED